VQRSNASRRLRYRLKHGARTRQQSRKPTSRGEKTSHRGAPVPGERDTQRTLTGRKVKVALKSRREGAASGWVKNVFLEVFGVLDGLKISPYPAAHAIS